MKLHLEEKEVKAIMEVSKFACAVTGKEMPSGMELMKNIVNNNSKLFSIKPNFFNGSVDVEISSDYTTDATGLYLKYGPILVGMYQAFTCLVEDVKKDFTAIAEKYDKPLKEKEEKKNLTEEEMF
jgi:hypothetical protein